MSVDRMARVAMHIADPPTPPPLPEPTGSCWHLPLVFTPTFPLFSDIPFSIWPLPVCGVPANLWVLTCLYITKVLILDGILKAFHWPFVTMMMISTYFLIFLKKHDTSLKFLCFDVNRRSDVFCTLRHTTSPSA